MPQRVQYGSRTSFGIRVGFIEWYIVFTICLSTVIQLSKQKSYSNKRKEKDRRFPPEIITLVTMVTTLYTTSLAPLSYSTASVSLLIPLSAANRLSAQRSLYPTVPRNEADNDLRRTVPNCPQLTPIIALSVVPTMFGYKMK